MVTAVVMSVVVVVVVLAIAVVLEMMLVKVPLVKMVLLVVTAVTVVLLVLTVIGRVFKVSVVEVLLIVEVVSALVCTGPVIDTFVEVLAVDIGVDALFIVCNVEVDLSMGELTDILRDILTTFEFVLPVPLEEFRC